MRPMLGLAILSAVLGAAPALQIVRPVISDRDGGASDPPGFEHAPGETLYFSCRGSGFTKSEEEQVHIRYSVQAFDPQGVPLTEPDQREIQAEVTPQDKDWLPKIATEIQIPPLVASGTYKIVVNAEDLLAKSSTELTVPFQVRGYALEPSDTIVVRNFRFYRSEQDTQPVEKAVYQPGDSVWARFDITGYQYGPKNRVDVSYVVSLLNTEGKTLYRQPEPAVEQSESFYPKRYVPATMALNLQKDIAPGEYTIRVEVKDAIGGRTNEGKYPFLVEKP